MAVFSDCVRFRSMTVSLCPTAHQSIVPERSHMLYNEMYWGDTAEREGETRWVRTLKEWWRNWKGGRDGRDTTVQQWIQLSICPQYCVSKEEWDSFHCSPLLPLSPILPIFLIILPPSPSSSPSVLSFIFFLFFNFSPFFPSSLSFCLISSPSQSSYPPFCLLHSSLYLSGSCPTIYSVTAVQPVSHCQAEAHGQYSYDGTCLYYLLSSACFAFRGTKWSKLNLVPALWLLLTLTIHFYKKGYAPTTAKLLQIENHWSGINCVCGVVSCVHFVYEDSEIFPKLRPAVSVFLYGVWMSGHAYVSVAHLSGSRIRFLTCLGWSINEFQYWNVISLTNV